MKRYRMRTIVPGTTAPAPVTLLPGDSLSIKVEDETVYGHTFVEHVTIEFDDMEVIEDDDKRGEAE